MYQMVDTKISIQYQQLSIPSCNQSVIHLPSIKISTLLVFLQHNYMVDHSYYIRFKHLEDTRLPHCYRDYESYSLFMYCSCAVAVDKSIH